MKMNHICIFLFAAILFLFPAASIADSGQADTGGHLTCGAAKKDIAPPKELMPKLLGIMQGAPFEEVVDGLYVRVIAIGNETTRMLFVGYELDQAPFPAETLKKIHETHGIAEENIFLLGNHGHAAPVTGIRLAEPSRNQKREQPEYYEATVAYEKIVLKAMYEAVDEAIDNMRPAKIGYGSGDSFVNARGGMGGPLPDHAPRYDPVCHEDRGSEGKSHCLPPELFFP